VKEWKKAMNSLQTSDMQTGHVSALFADSAISFSLSKGTTFADLADSLDQLGDRHLGMPMAIYLTIGVADQPISTLHSGI
jgi:hypothetical protein